MVKSEGVLIVSAPRSSSSFALAGLHGAIITEVFMIKSFGSSPRLRMSPSTFSKPMSETRTLRTPSSTARCTSRIANCSCSLPRRLKPRLLPAGENTWAPMSNVPLGPMNRFISMSAARPIATISRISSSVISMMPEPWLVRWIGTFRATASSSTTCSARGLSVDGISMRQCAPSGNRNGDS